ncbi:TIGR03067 domain-containing protein [Roseivirga sp.]|uniref:TIGR03067 domain-containing protein n=1 Tax=Roseivirga sp. TaxID=1964215 RepID=UPI003B52798A
MRNICLFLLAFILFGCSNQNGENLNGTWIPVEQEIGGQPLPETSFSSQRLTIADSLYTMQAESLDRGTIEMNEGKLDIYGTEGPNAGRHIRGIYKYENNLLIVCYDLSGQHYPEDFSTQGHALYFMAKFKKEEE